MINKGPVSYMKSSIDDQSPFYESPENGGYEHYQEKIDAEVIKARDDSFRDHFSQATAFYKSISKVEQNHIINAFSFELSKVKREEIRQVLANHLQTDISNVSVKASTSEGLSFTGKGLGIEARSVVLLEEKNA